MLCCAGAHLCLPCRPLHACMLVQTACDLESSLQCQRWLPATASAGTLEIRTFMRALICGGSRVFEASQRASDQARTTGHVLTFQECSQRHRRFRQHGIAPVHSRRASCNAAGTRAG